MGKASSRNARQNSNRNFARLQNTGKSMYEIAAIAKCDQRTVFQYFSSLGVGNRRNEGFVRHLRKSGAHWSIIASVMGTSFEEIQEHLKLGTYPRAAWVEGLEPQSLRQEVISDLFEDEHGSESDQPESYSGGTENIYGIMEGQIVRIKNEAAQLRPELLPLLGENMQIIHIEGNQIVIRVATGEEDETGFDSDQLVLSSDVDLVVEIGPISRGDDVLYSKDGVAYEPAIVTATMTDNEGNESYALRIKNDSTYVVANKSEIKPVINVEKANLEDMHFYFKDHQSNAEGIVDGQGGITVLAGSIGRGARTRSANSTVCSDRLNMLEHETAIIEDGNLKVTKDYHFSSLHRASSALSGYNSSGRTGWRNKEGKTYNEVQKELLDS